MKRLTLTATMIAALVGAACGAPPQQGPQVVQENEDDAYETSVYAEARSEWEPLAEQGDATAQKNLGVMYYLGQGVEPDYAQAFEWFSKAAAQGEDVAQLSLGVMYSEGQGVPQDPVKAHMWMSLSAKQGNISAEHRLQELTPNMSAEQITAAEQAAEAWTPSGS